MIFSMVSSLPPTLAISEYTVDLLKEMDALSTGEVFAFNKIYPKFLYPGEINDFTFKTPVFNNIDISSELNWNNPLGWINTGKKVSSPLVHLQWWSPPLAPMYYTIIKTAKQRGKKIIFTVHNILPHESKTSYKILTNMVMKQGDHYIVHSENNMKELLETYKYIKKEKVSIIHHGIKQSEKLNYQNTRKRLGIFENHITILFFGAIREYKGLDLLIKALNYVQKKHKKIFLIIAGKNWVDFKPYLDMLNQYNLSDRTLLDIKMIPTEDISLYFSAADLTILPYKHFTSQSGVSSLAISYKLPIIVSDVGGLPDFAANDAVFKNGDINQLSNLITKFIENSEYREHLLNETVKKQEKYSYKKMAEMTIETYKTVLNK